MIALEARQPNGMGGNAYVYWPVEEGDVRGQDEERKERGPRGKTGRRQVWRGINRCVAWCRQCVISGRTVIVGLCERQLVLLQGL